MKKTKYADVNKKLALVADAISPTVVVKLVTLVCK